MITQQLQHHYEGAGFLRQRLLLATLTGMPVRISRMHVSPHSFEGVAGSVDSFFSDESSGHRSFQQQHTRGVQPYEASLLRLLCSITEGSRVHINAAGTTLTYYPGQLVGCDPEKRFGAPLLHHCHSSKPVSYYLEPLLLLAPFCKHALHIRLTGVTDPEASPRCSRRSAGAAKQRSSSHSGRGTKKASRDETSTHGDGGRISDSEDHVSDTFGSCTEINQRSSDSSEWNFLCLDPPIDYVRSVTIPSLHRLLRLATSLSRRDVKDSVENSSCDNNNRQRQDGGVGVRTSDLPDPFYMLRVVRRCCGSRTGGMWNGEVLLKTCGTLREPLQPFVWIDVGRVKRIRGTAFTVGGLNPLFAKRCISRARFIFNMLLPDVWIYLDKQQPKQRATARNAASVRTAGTTETTATAQGEEEEAQQQGSGAGLGLALVAETIKKNYKGAAGIWSVKNTSSATASAREGSNGLLATTAADAWRVTGSCKLKMLLKQHDSTEASSVTAATDGSTVEGTAGGGEEEAAETLEENAGSEEESAAEKLAEAVARRLLLEVQQGGVVDTAHQYMPLLFAALAEEHAVSRIRLPRLTPYAVQFIRHLRDFLGVIFHVEDEAVAATSFGSIPLQQCEKLGGFRSSPSRNGGVTLKTLWGAFVYARFCVPTVKEELFEQLPYTGRFSALLPVSATFWSAETSLYFA